MSTSRSDGFERQDATARSLEHERLERETVLVKVHAPAAARAGLISLAGACGAHVVDVGTTTLVFVLTDAPDQVASFLDLLRPLGAHQVARSGRIAMPRGQMAPSTLGGEARARLGRAPALPPTTGLGEAEPTRSQADGSYDAGDAATGCPA